MRQLPGSRTGRRQDIGNQCGYIESGIIPQFSLCSEGVAWFEAQGKFQDGSYVPAVGDLIFFDWGNDGSVNHVGIVESVADGRVNTIEGNSGNKCAKRSYWYCKIASEVSGTSKYAQNLKCIFVRGYAFNL